VILERRPELTEPDDYLRNALESLPEAIAVFDASERFEFWNRQFSLVYAAEGVEIQVGLTFEQHLRRAIAAGLVKEAVGREDACVAGRLVWFRSAGDTRQHQLADGRWLRVQDTRMPDAGTVGIRTDITEQVSTQLSLRLLFEANSTALFLLDRATLMMTDVNEAALELYGYGFASVTSISDRKTANRVALTRRNSRRSQSGQMAWSLPTLSLRTKYSAMSPAGR
jgi:PAS domain-containing protein